MHSQIKNWLVCFDISDDRLRTEIGKRLLQHGDRVQDSVFEVFFDKPQTKQALQVELSELISLLQ